MAASSIHILSLVSLTALAAWFSLLAAGEGASDLGALADPRIGGAANGYTLPGATRPFGMLACGPYKTQGNRKPPMRPWAGIGMVHSSGAVGMSHRTVAFHVSSGAVVPGWDRSSDLSDLVARPGSFSARFMPSDVLVETTVTDRCAFIRLTPSGDLGVTLLFPMPDYRHKPADVPRLAGPRSAIGGPGTETGRSHQFLEWDLDPLATGVVDSRSATTMTVAELVAKPGPGLWVGFPPGKTVHVRIGLSYVDLDGARKNLAAEIPDWDFTARRAAAVAAWESELGRFTVEGGTADQRARFVTAMYHAQIMPCVFNDVDGRYMGYRLKDGRPRIDGRRIITTPGNVPEMAEPGRTVYSTFSGWDIYRTQWPLLCLIQRERAGDLAMSMVLIQDQAGFLARWPVVSAPSINMQGMALTHMLATAVRYQVPRIDPQRILGAVLADAAVPNAAEGNVLPKGKDALLDDPGWIPGNVSVTQEVAHGFAAIAGLSHQLGDLAGARLHARRSLVYGRSYDPGTGEFRSRDLAGAWVPGGYCEGVAANYRWLVPHDVPGLIALLGGEQTFKERLEAYRKKGYDGSNEYDFHAPFLFAYAGEPAKTQDWVRWWLDRAFPMAPPMGTPGDEDCGTMSAYFIFASCGLFPVDPASGHFVLCSPVFTRSRMAVGDGRYFTIEAPAASAKNRYIQSATLDGKPYERSVIEVDRLLAGGTLTFELGPEPSTWGSAPGQRPGANPVLSLVTVE